MTGEAQRRERLEQMLDLAQAYRGWTRKQLARALGRDASNLAPASGLPKLDLVVELARALEWSVEEVVGSIWLDDICAPQREGGCELPDDFEWLESTSRRANREGRNLEAVRLARKAAEIARTSEERAIARIRESCGWDALGRYGCSLEASRRGLAEPGVSCDRRRMLQGNLANGYYALWQPLEARIIAHDLVEALESCRRWNRVNRVLLAFAYYVRGQSNRRLITLEPARDQDLALSARADLAKSECLFLELAGGYGEEAYRAIANTCRGGIVEVDVVLGELDTSTALAKFTSGLEAIVEPNNGVVGDWLESYGWWCIYGCNIALRHVRDQRAVQQHMAVFTNKADEVAEQTHNWAMRERIVSMEYARRARFDEWTGMESDWTIDTDDVRGIAGTMGRFPSFYETGWRILRSARIVREP